MPHIIVKLWKGKSEAQKKKLAEELTQTAMSVIGYGVESFSVAIEDIDPNDWKENVYKPYILGHKQPGYKM
jgi:4-oxalocrotonate tautomerase